MINETSDYASAIQESLTSADIFNQGLSINDTLDRVKAAIEPIATTALMEGGRTLATNAYNSAKSAALEAVGGVKDQLIQTAKTKAADLMRSYGATEDEITNVLKGDFTKAMTERVDGIVSRGKAVVEDAVSQAKSAGQDALTQATSAGEGLVGQGEGIVSQLAGKASSLEDMASNVLSTGRSLLSTASAEAPTSLFESLSSKLGSAIDSVRSSLINNISSKVQSLNIQDLPDLEGLTNIPSKLIQASPFDIGNVGGLVDEVGTQYSMAVRGMAGATDLLSDSQFASALSERAGLLARGALISKGGYQIPESALTAGEQSNTSVNIAQAFKTRPQQLPEQVPDQVPEAPQVAETSFMTQEATPVINETIAPTEDIASSLISDASSTASTLAETAASTASQLAETAGSLATGAITSGLETAGAVADTIPGVGEVLGPALAIIGGLAGIFTGAFEHNKPPPKPIYLNPSVQFL